MDARYGWARGAAVRYLARAQLDRYCDTGDREWLHPGCAGSPPPCPWSCSPPAARGRWARRAPPRPGRIATSTRPRATTPATRARCRRRRARRSSTRSTAPYRRHRSTWRPAPIRERLLGAVEGDPSNLTIVGAGPGATKVTGYPAGSDGRLRLQHRERAGDAARPRGHRRATSQRADRAGRRGRGTRAPRRPCPTSTCRTMPTPASSASRRRSRPPDRTSTAMEPTASRAWLRRLWRDRARRHGLARHQLRFVQRVCGVAVLAQPVFARNARRSGRPQGSPSPARPPPATAVRASPTRAIRVRACTTPRSAGTSARACSCRAPASRSCTPTISNTASGANVPPVEGGITFEDQTAQRRAAGQPGEGRPHRAGPGAPSDR